MLPLLILLGISLVGIGVVLWLLKNDSGANDLSIVKLEPNQLTQSDFNHLTGSSPKNTKASFLNILNFLKPKEAMTADLSETIFSKNQSAGKNLLSWLSPLKKRESTGLEIKEQLETEKKMFYKNHSTSTPASGTASLKTNASNHHQQSLLSKEESLSVEKIVESSTKLDELRSKYEKLDKMFKEKSLEFDKASETLNNELRVKKEFNKVKDILEKELADTREKVRLSQADLNAAKVENDGVKKRSEQLEEKVTKLEKELLGKEEFLNGLNKTAEKLTQLQGTVMPLEEKIAELQKTLVQKEEIITEQKNTIEQLKQTQASHVETSTPAIPSLPLEEPPQINASVSPQPHLNPQVSETAPEPEKKSPDEFLSLKPDVLSQPPPEPPKLEEK